MKRRGRRAGTSGDSKRAILDVARSLFAKHGFRGTTLRGVADRARVDVALVSYFFGSKKELFAAVVDLPAIACQLEQLVNDRRPGRGERLVRFHLEGTFPAMGQSISALLRTALGNPEDVPRLRTLLRDTVLKGMNRALRGPTAELRAELVGALMTGLFISRHLVRVEPLASSSAEQIARILGPVIDGLLDEPNEDERADAPVPRRRSSQVKETRP
jgi:AcrR family transcriptional regulator